MRAVGNFTLINAPEADIFAFDFTSILAPGETITGFVPDAANAWQIGIETGADPTPNGHKVGPAQIQGNMIVQKCQGFLQGVDYWMSGQILTSNGRTPLLWGSLPCGVIGC